MNSNCDVDVIEKKMLFDVENDFYMDDAIEEFKYFKFEVIEQENVSETYIKTANKHNDIGKIFIKRYLEKLAEENLNINSEKQWMSGKPRVQDTRIPITTILTYLKDGETFKALEEDFELKKFEIEAALKYMIDIIEYPYE